MRYRALALVLGIGLFQLVPIVPHAALYFASPPIIVCIVWLPRIRLLAIAAFGFIWAMGRAELILTNQLPVDQLATVFSAHGVVESLAVQGGYGRSFDFAATRVEDLRGNPVITGKIKLVAYTAGTLIEVGAQCDFKVRLKTPYGSRNPASFDREKWLFTERINATGYVLDHPSNSCRQRESPWSLSRLRRSLASTMREALAGNDQVEAVIALGVADRSRLSEAQWQVLRDTGTAHLIAISGLHISLIASVVFVLARWAIASLASTQRIMPAQRPAAVVAVVVASGYAALAGFPISTQRALVMLVVAMGCLFWRRPVASFDAYVFALACVCVFDPTALLLAGFWLSFAAVGWLLLVTATRPSSRGLRAVWRIHIYLAIGMTPLLGILHQALPLASPLANFVAVPIVSVGVVPLVVGGIVLSPFSPSLAALLWSGAALIWDLLWSLLSLLAISVPPMALPATPGASAVWLAIVGVAALIIPILRTRMLVGGALVGALFIDHHHAIPVGQLRVTVADVGQGLAVVVETTNKTLVYDTGPTFGRFSAGADIVVPLMRARGIRVVDRLIISHGDSDHAGGWQGLRAAIPVLSTWVSPSMVAAPDITVCGSQQRWDWDGVVFQILGPRNAESNTSRNNLSCVLKITAQGGQVLLPGDIESAAEADLVREAVGALNAEILVAPHHGSRTSSAIRFISAVRPRFVVFASGYRNKFGFPHKDVVARYRELGADPFITGVTGAIEFYIGDRVFEPSTYRRSHRRYWHKRNLN